MCSVSNANSRLMLEMNAWMTVLAASSVIDLAISQRCQSWECAEVRPPGPESQVQMDEKGNPVEDEYCSLLL